jgi:hypothetical protein
LPTATVWMAQIKAALELKFADKLFFDVFEVD